MKTLLALIKKDLGDYLNSSLIFFVTIPFLLISFFLYFRTAFVFGQATLRPYFDLLPWFLVLLAPALTMQTLTEEKSKKTLEILLAHPLSETKIILSKFCGSFIFYFLILLTTLTLCLPLLFFSRPDGGELVGGYLGALLTGAVFLSLGILASSLVENSLGSFILAAAGSFLLIILGTDVLHLTLPGFLSSGPDWLGIISHQQTLSRGLLDFSDLAYFLTFIVLFLLLAVYKISGVKISELRNEKRKLQNSLFLIIVLGLLLNITLAKVPLRLDLTSAKIYSISQATKSIVNSLDDILTINLYGSPDLPPAAQIILKRSQDFLADLARLNPKIKVENFYPQGRDETAQKAINEGLVPIQFNTLGASSYQVQEGFLGLSLRYLNKNEAIPFIQEAESLEYKTTQLLKKLVNKNRHQIVLYTPEGTNDTAKFSRLIQELNLNFDLKVAESNLDLRNPQPDLLVVAGVKEPLKSENVEKIKSYLSDNGRALLLLDKVSAGASFDRASLTTTGLEDLIKAYGVALDDDLAFDLNLSETIQVSQATVNFLLPYPFWVKSIPAEAKFIPASQIRSLTLFWPSSLTLNQTESFRVQPVFKSSNGGGTLTGDQMIVSPTKLNQINFGSPGREVIFAALVVNKQNNEPKMLVISDSDFLSDNYLSPNSPVPAFAANLIDYLSSGSQEIVPIKSGLNNVFVFSAPWQPALITWLVSLGTAFLVALFAFLRLWRRRLGFKRTYEILG